jgi:hypothetical protein
MISGRANSSPQLERNRFGADLRFLEMLCEQISPFIEVFIPQQAAFCIIVLR